MPPYGADDDGTVAREIVLAVLLRDGDVVVSKDGDSVTLSKGDIADVYVFPERIARNMLHRLARRYGVNMHRFYLEAKAKAIDSATKVS